MNTATNNTNTTNNRLRYVKGQMLLVTLAQTVPYHKYAAAAEAYAIALGHLKGDATSISDFVNSSSLTKLLELDLSNRAMLAEAFIVAAVLDATRASGRRMTASERLESAKDLLDDMFMAGW